MSACYCIAKSTGKVPIGSRQAATCSALSQEKLKFPSGTATARVIRMLHGVPVPEEEAGAPAPEQAGHLLPVLEEVCAHLPQAVQGVRRCSPGAHALLFTLLLCYRLS